MALRQGNTLYRLLPDHLGSTAITANSSGGKYGELRYKAWGETRYTWGTTPTAYKFTGQRLDESTGLYYYEARYYDPALGRFVQADTVVPEPGETAGPSTN
ncbi:MAG: RHS repeat-associated core domain-containing protein, partial [Anaerolineae bacterium]